MEDLYNASENLISRRLRARFDEALKRGNDPGDILLEACAKPCNEEIEMLPLFLCARKEKEQQAKTNGNAAGVPSRSEGAAAFRLRSKRHPICPAPPFTNRGADNLLDGEPPSQPIFGGYDGGVEVGFTGDWQTRDFARLKSQLDKARQASEQDEGDEKYVELCGIPFHVKPNSAGGHVFYRYIIEGGGIKVYIHHNPQGQIQAVRARYGSEALTGRDLYDVHDNFKQWLNELGFKPRKECISRLDPQVMTKRDIMEYAEVLATNRVVSKARKDQMYRNRNTGRLETYTIGSKIQLCIYDKKAELLQGRDEVKVFTVLDECLCGEMPEFLTRIEFRLRRDFLNEIGIDTMDDLKACEAELVQYLTHEYFRLLANEKTSGNEWKQKTHPIWQEVQELFKTYFPGSDREKRPFVRGRKKVTCTGKDLKDQALGCLSSAVALCMGYVSEPVRALDYLVETIRENLSKLVSRSREKVKELGIIRGVESIASDDWWLDPKYACASSEDAFSDFKAVYDEDIQYQNFRNVAVAGCPF